MSVRPYILSENNWLNVKDQFYDIAVLPWGATEPHNYHLPFGTDTIQSEYISAESAAIAWQGGAKIIVLPTVPWGVNTGQTDLKLCLNIMPGTQMILLNDLVENLKRHSINKLVIINSHGGNDFVPLIRELSVKHPEVFICTINWWTVCKGTDYFEEPGDHAGEMETSVMLEITPELVLPLDKAGDGSVRNFKPAALRERWAWAQRKWSEISESTGVGNPKLATRKKGQVFLNASIVKIADFLSELSRSDTNDMYE
jgi:creatinine amidohydrolase